MPATVDVAEPRLRSPRTGEAERDVKRRIGRVDVADDEVVFRRDMADATAVRTDQTGGEHFPGLLGQIARSSSC